MKISKISQFEVYIHHHDGLTTKRRACLLCRRPRFGTHLEPMVGRSLTVHPAANGNPVETLGDKSGEERNWLPYLKKQMAQDKCPL